MITIKLIALVFGAGVLLAAFSDFTPDFVLAIVAACFS
jgi:hypothetical protein